MADDRKEKLTRSIQEYVPGKQVTLAHVIAHPKNDVYVKLGLDDENDDAIGILVGTKAAPVEIGFLDRFSGSLVITGRVSDVNSSIREIINFLKNTLGFDIPDHITHS